MSDRQYAKGHWQEIAFEEMQAGDWIAVVTQVTNDAPTIEPYSTPIIKVSVTEEEIIYRWIDEEDE
jgi:hypothetical protein